MNQNFSPDQLIKLCKKSEIESHRTSKPLLLQRLDTQYQKITDGTFEFDFNLVNGFFITNDLAQILLLRKLNDNIKRLYKDEQSNRRVIIKQVKTLLADTCPIWVLRTDISSFYESIDRKRILEKLQNDTLLSYFTIWLLNNLFYNSIVKDYNGLPRGIGISATLSELYMRKFDKWVRTEQGVYYFARFVDDIIIFGHKKEVIEKINTSMNDNLEKGLKKNKAKTKYYDASFLSTRKPLEYLGYKFTTQNGSKSNKEVIVSIADKKVNKIKSRIVYAFVDFIKTKNYPLLENRIKFLTGNYRIKSTIDGNDLKAGIHYNYFYVTELKVFQELNLFFYKTLNSKTNSFGNKLSASFKPGEKDNLAKYSFKHGFANKAYYSFNAGEMKEIKNCWR